MWTLRRGRVLVPVLVAVLLSGACSGHDEAAADADAPVATTTAGRATAIVTTGVAPATTNPPTTILPTTIPPSTIPPATTTPPAPAPAPPAPATTAAPPAPAPLPAGVATFRLPMNGRVQVSLAWDCGGCVAELGAKHHPAIDYVPRDDTTVVAAGEGTVLVVNDGCDSPSQGCGESMGNSVFLRHVLADGSVIHTFYAHLREIDPAVVVGACLRAGQRIGEMGSSGIASAPHLHFAFQLTPEILQYTVGSSYDHGSRDPDDYYGVVEVRPCAR